MNISKLKKLIPASFTYEYTDPETGETATEDINLELNRMTFGVATSKQFRAAIDDQDSNAIAGFLSETIATWNLDLAGEVFEPSAENILACPADFVVALAESVFSKLNGNPPKANGSDSSLEQAESSLAALTTAS